MSLLSNWTGVHISPHKSYINRDQMGNALKNIAPAAFLIPGIGTAAAMGLGGLGSAFGRGIQHGANLGDILEQGASGAAIAGGGAQGMNALRGAFAPSSAAAGTSAATSAGANAGMVSGPSAFDASGHIIGGSMDQGIRQGVGHALSSAARFAGSNPLAVSQGLSALSSIPQMGSENRLRNAQANQMQQQANESDYEFQQRKARDAALEPLRRALAAQIGQSLTPGQPGQLGQYP